MAHYFMSERNTLSGVYGKTTGQCHVDTVQVFIISGEVFPSVLEAPETCPRLEQIPEVSEKLFRVGRVCSPFFTVLNIGPEERCVGFDLTENLITWNLQHFIFEVKPEGNFLKCMCVLFTCQRIF